jgi:hypothetical protein
MTQTLVKIFCCKGIETLAGFCKQMHPYRS